MIYRKSKKILEKHAFSDENTTCIECYKILKQNYKNTLRRE